MATLSKQWSDGGSLSVTYDGDGDGSAIFSSSTNEGIDREMSVTFVDVSRKVSATRTVRQVGKREILYASDGALYASDGTTLNVLKS